MCVENAFDFAGTYRSKSRTLTLSAEGEKLVLHLREGSQVVLEKRGEDRFYVYHLDFERFLLHFGRAASGDDSQGEVVEARHGADWYVGDQYTGPREQALCATYSGSDYYRFFTP